MPEARVPAEPPLHSSHDFPATPGAVFNEQVRRFLQEGCSQFGLPCGTVTRVDGDKLFLEFVAHPSESLNEGMAFDLCQTFCAEVLERGHPIAIQHASESEWRDHAGVRVLGLQAYLGVPIQVDGRQFGTVCFFDTEPHDRPWTEKDLDLLQLIGRSVQTAVEHEKMIQRFRAGLAGAASATGAEFFRVMVAQVAGCLGAEISIVAECDESFPGSARTLAVWEGGAIIENYEYEMIGSPCGDIQGDGLVYHSRGIQRAYPNDRWLAEKRLQSYVGVAIVGADGRHLGHLAALHTGPMHVSAWDRWLLELMAARAAAEIDRRRSAVEQRRLETEVAHAEKLKSLGVLAGGIAHDFNNLLTGILGNATLALTQLDHGSPGFENIRQIEQAATRAGGLTKQMLAYSGRGALEVELLDLSGVVQDISELLGSAVSRAVTLRRDLARDLPPIQADASQIRQIVMNLLMNASDSMEDRSGQVVLRTGQCPVAEEDRHEFILGAEMSVGDAVFVEVEDNGVGMNEDTLRQMFDPFFSTKFSGSGLGLSAVLGIVRGYQGGIRVDSEPERGTRIRVVFPAQGSAAADVSQPEEARRGTGSFTGGVLVVDDEELVRNVARDVLLQAGATVFTACDGVEGLEAFHRHRSEIHTVLLDLTMPRMDGRAAAKVIHRESPETPVFLMSGYDEQAATRQFADLHLAGFIEKPFRLEDLPEKLSAGSGS